jgi:hypothetical protein
MEVTRGGPEHRPCAARARSPTTLDRLWTVRRTSSFLLTFARHTALLMARHPLRPALDSSRKRKSVGHRDGSAQASMRRARKTLLRRAANSNGWALGARRPARAGYLASSTCMQSGSGLWLSSSVLLRRHSPPIRYALHLILREDISAGGITMEARERACSCPCSQQERKDGKLETT